MLWEANSENTVILALTCFVGILIADFPSSFVRSLLVVPS